MDGRINMTKLTLLKITLTAAAVYYIIGGIAHYFALTIFPWFDGHLYAPYQDSVIALVTIVLAAFLLAVARDPIKNRDTLNVIIGAAFLASLFSIFIVFKVDFAALGAPAKKLQTIVEGILGFGFVGLLLWLYPRKK